VHLITIEGKLQILIWRKPPTDTCKVNIDASFISSNRSTSIRVIIGGEFDKMI